MESPSFFELRRKLAKGVEDRLTVITNAVDQRERKDKNQQMANKNTSDLKGKTLKIIPDKSPSEKSKHITLIKRIKTSKELSLFEISTWSIKERELAATIQKYLNNKICA